MSYAVMTMDKRKSSDIKWSENHNERKNNTHSNKDIDLQKKCLNYQIIECNNYKKAIMDRIEKGYTQNKVIRKDAVTSTEFIFTSDKQFFQNISEEKERLYFEKSIEFLKKEFGEKNVVTATVHKDETTPHLHATIVPITNDGRLSMKSFLDGKKELSQFQDRFYDHITKDFPQLERGKSTKETGVKHLSVEEYKKKTDFNEKNLNVLEQEKVWVKNIYEKSQENKVLFKNEVKVQSEDFLKLSQMALDNSIKTVSLKKEIILNEEKETLTKENLKLKSEIYDISKKLESKTKAHDQLFKFIEKNQLLDKFECFKSEIAWDVAKKWTATRDSYLTNLSKKKEPNDFEKNLIQSVVKQKEIER